MAFPGILPNFNRFFEEFSMIHHFARAFHLRSIAPQLIQTSLGAERGGALQTPDRSAHVNMARRLRICSDPADARRTVITGRFADVCAALDRMVREQEAAA